MKELITISTNVGERLEEIIRIVGDALVSVTEYGTEALVNILVTEKEWSVIKPELQTGKSYEEPCA